MGKQSLQLQRFLSISLHLQRRQANLFKMRLLLEMIAMRDGDGLKPYEAATDIQEGVLDKNADQAFDLEGFLPYRLAAASSHVSREFAALYRDQFGLSLAEWRILAHLSQVREVSVRDIYDRVDMDKSKVSRAAASLEQAGLVEKLANLDDRRLVSLSLTEAGQNLIGKIIPLALAFQERLLSRLGKTASVLDEGLDRLTD